MSSKRYAYVKTDGSVRKGVRALTILRIAAQRLKAGTGPFTVIRAGWYKHPGIRRAAALRMTRAQVRNVPVGDRITVLNKKGDVVFAWHRIANAEMYRNPLRDCAGLQGLRQDQGVDYSVSVDSPVYAIGPGVVTIYRTTSGWPGGNAGNDPGAYIAYKLTDGPAAGKYVYFAENITLNPNLKVGDKVDSGTRICTLHPNFANCETGWAGSGSTYGFGPGDAPEAVECYREGDRTAAGDNFDKFMQALGAPAGLTEGRSIRCSLPAGYPRASAWKDKV